MCQSRNVGQGTSSAKFCQMIKQTGRDSFTTHNPQLYHLRDGRERKYLRALGAPSWSTWLREPVQLGWPGLRHLQRLVLRWSVWSVTQFHDSWCTQPCRQSCQSPCPFASHMVYGLSWSHTYAGRSDIAILCIMSKTFVQMISAASLSAPCRTRGSWSCAKDTRGTRPSGPSKTFQMQTLSHSWKFSHGFTFHFLNLRTLVNLNILVASKASKLLSGLHEMAFIFIVTSYCMRAGREQNFQLCVSWMKC